MGENGRIGISIYLEKTWNNLLQVVKDSSSGLAIPCYPSGAEDTRNNTNYGALSPVLTDTGLRFFFFYFFGIFKVPSAACSLNKQAQLLCAVPTNSGNFASIL